MSDLSELFERDPLKMTHEDIEVIIKRMREAQAQFELGVPRKPGKVVAAKREKVPVSVDILAKLGL